MRLLFIRHGDPDYEHDSLTETGFKEARALGEKLGKENIDVFYCSTMGRALRTAEPTLNAHGAEAIMCDWLREFNHPVNRSEDSGIAWDFLPEKWKNDSLLYGRDTWLDSEIFRGTDIKKHYDKCIEEFEKVLASHGYERNGELYRVRESNHKTIAFFGHFGMNSVLISHLLGVNPFILWHNTVIPPTGVTTFYSEERRDGIASFRMSGLGDVSHLYSQGLEPSFAARFCECYADDTRHD